MITTDPASGVTPDNAASFAGIFRAVEGLRNFKAAAAMIGCAVAGVLVAGLLLFAASGLGFVASLLAFVVLFVAVGTGVNAAGLLHMDVARGISPRSVVDAVIHGLACIPKLIVLALAVFVVELAVFLVIAVLMLICKIPFLGPLLFTVVFPVSVVAAGLTIFGLFLGLALSLPAIWQGATIARALAQTFAIIRSRLVESMLLLFGVGFLAFAVGLVVFGVIGVGMAPTLGLAGSIVGFSGGGVGGIVGMAQGFGGGHAIAGAIGGAVLWAVAASLVAQVNLRGLCLVYLRVTEGLDLTAAEASLRAGFDEARRRAAEIGDKAKAAARPDSPPTPAAAANVAAAPAAGVAPVAPVVAAGATAAAAAASPFAVPPPLFAPGPAPVPPRVPVAPVPDDSLDVTLPPRTTTPAFEPSTLPTQRMTDIDLSFGDNSAADIDLPIAPTPEPASAAMPRAALEPAPEPTAAPAGPTCPQCAATVTGDDVFCGVCGYRLK